MKIIKNLLTIYLRKYIIRTVKAIVFEERYPEVSTYGLEAYSPVYLENGVVLIDKEWNGEVYTVKDEEGKERTYRPVQEPDEVDDDGEVLQWKTTGYEEEF